MGQFLPLWRHNKRLHSSLHFVGVLSCHVIWFFDPQLVALDTHTLSLSYPSPTHTLALTCVVLDSISNVLVQKRQKWTICDREKYLKNFIENWRKELKVRISNRGHWLCCGSIGRVVTNCKILNIIYIHSQLLKWWQKIKRGWKEPIFKNNKL